MFKLNFLNETPRKSRGYPKKLNPVSQTSLNHSFREFGTSKEYPISSNLKMKVFYKNHQTRNPKSIMHVFELENGIYTYVIYVHNEKTKVKYCKVETLEIGTKHAHICSTIPKNSTILIAGELEKKDKTVMFNYESGTYSATILDDKRLKRINMNKLDKFVKEVLFGLQDFSNYTSSSYKFLYEQLQNKKLIKTKKTLIPINYEDIFKTLSRKNYEHIIFKLNNDESVKHDRILQLLKSYTKAGVPLSNSIDMVKKIIRTSKVSKNKRDSPKRSKVK